MPASDIPTDIRRTCAQRPFPLNWLVFSDRTANCLRTTARTWISVAAAIFIGMALRSGIPQHPERSDWDIYVQIALLAFVIVGALISWRWEGAGASIIVASALGLGALAAVELHLLRAFLDATVFFVPGVLFWLVWQRTKSVRDIGFLATVLAVGLALGGYYAIQTYATHFGPVQPESSLAVEPGMLIDWIWAGGMTDTSVVIRAAMKADLPDAQLAISASEDLTDVQLVAPMEGPGASGRGLLSFNVENLSPDTDYWYAVTANGITDSARKGHVRTFPPGAASFTFAFGACANTGSNGIVFDTIRETDPLFFLSTGDFFYEDIAVNDPALYRSGFDQNLQSPAQGTLYRTVPIAYIWDDHDYGPNNSDRTSAGRAAAQANYREVVPHYPLAADAESGAIYQSFTVGRVRFILTDNRSERSPNSAPDDANKTMLGAEQKAWLKQELLNANGIYPVIVWVNSQPWIAPAQQNGEGWGLFATERREIADFITDNDIRGLTMLSGDAHMLAIDDGSNNTFSSDGIAGFPVFHAAALDRHGGVKGGPYSEGSYSGGGQFGLMTVNDDGGSSVEIIWSGRNYEGQEIIRYQFRVDATPAGTGAVDRMAHVAPYPVAMASGGAVLEQRHHGTPIR